MNLFDNVFCREFAENFFEGFFNKDERTLANKARDRLTAQWRQIVRRHCLIDGADQIVERVDQRSIKIEK